MSETALIACLKCADVPAAYDPDMPMRRPHPVQWLRYQYTGRLPAEYREWVLHDSTCPTWMLRVVIRGCFHIAPIAAVVGAVLMWLGSSWPLALGALLLGVLVVLRIAVTCASEAVDARLVRHGFPPGHGSTARQQLDEDAARRYREVWRRDEDAV